MMLPVGWFPHSKNSPTESWWIVILCQVFPDFLRVDSWAAAEELLQGFDHLSNDLSFIIQGLHTVVSWFWAKVWWDHSTPKLSQASDCKCSILQAITCIHIETKVENLNKA